jgi:ribosomal protein S18 acetylase RimI-like enzyme
MPMAVLYTIRPIEDSDFRAYVRLREEALRTDPDAFSSSYDEYQNVSTLNKEQFFQKMIQYPLEFMLGAFAAEGAQLLGMVGFQVPQHFRKRKHKGRLFGMYVSEAFRRQGIAVRLLEAMIRVAKEDAQCEQILLTVSPPASPAYQLYRKMGFLQYGVETQALKTSNGYVDEVLMLKYL